MAARNKVTAALLKATGTRSGIPDLFILCEGRLFGLELKIDRNKRSPAQIACHEQLFAARATLETVSGNRRGSRRARRKMATAAWTDPMTDDVVAMLISDRCRPSWRRFDILMQELTSTTAPFLGSRYIEQKIARRTTTPKKERAYR